MKIGQGKSPSGIKNNPELFTSKTKLQNKHGSKIQNVAYTNDDEKREDK